MSTLEQACAAEAARLVKKACEIRRVLSTSAQVERLPSGVFRRQQTAALAKEQAGRVAAIRRIRAAFPGLSHFEAKRHLGEAVALAWKTYPDRVEFPDRSFDGRRSDNLEA